jgi:hypothetical protein
VLALSQFPIAEAGQTDLRPLVEVLVVPALFLVVGAGAHITVNVFRGVARGEAKYRAWIPGASGEVPRELRHQTLPAIRANPAIRDVDLMWRLAWDELGVLGIDLAVGAFAVDAVSQVGRHIAAPPEYFWVVFGLQWLLFLAIVGYLALIEMEPLSYTANRQRAIVAILWGLLSMMSAFVFLH